MMRQGKVNSVLRKWYTYLTSKFLFSRSFPTVTIILTLCTHLNERQVWFNHQPLLRELLFYQTSHDQEASYSLRLHRGNEDSTIHCESPENNCCRLLMQWEKEEEGLHPSSVTYIPYTLKSVRVAYP